MARYQPPGKRGAQSRGMRPAGQLPPPDPALRQRALVALTLSLLSLIGLALGLSNLRRGILVTVVTLVFAVAAARGGRGGRSAGSCSAGSASPSARCGC